MKSKLVPVVLMLAIAACANADVKGLWEFSDTGNLTAATVGNDLGLVGTHTAMTGVDAGDGAVSIGIGSHYECTAGIPANGGGSWVNEYTLLFDIQYPSSSAGTWRAFFNTSNTNSNDSDYFIHPTDESWGVGSLGYTDNPTVGEFYSSPDTWYRAVMSVDLGGDSPFFKLYIDGVLVATHTSDVGLDGRMSLYTAPAVALILLGDEDGEDNEMYCSTLAIWDTPLTASEIAELGAVGGPISNKAIKITPEESVFVNPDTILEWAAPTGLSVSAYDVWFGTDPNTDSPWYNFNKIVDAKDVTTVDPSPAGVLEYDTLYYWRVDMYEPNLVSGLNEFMGEGTQWSFTTAPDAPVILTQPVSMVIAEGETAEYTVGGINILTYTWYKSDDAANNTPADDELVGAESPSPLLSIPDVQLVDEGYYYCVAANNELTDVSNVARLVLEKLIHHYPLDNESAADAVGGVNGTVVGDPNWIGGIDGGAISFDPTNGVNDYVVLGTASDLNFGSTQDFTVAFWVKTTGWEEDAGIISNKDWNYSANTGWGIFGYTDNVSLRCNFNAGDNTSMYLGNEGDQPAISDGQWHHVCVTYDRDGSQSGYLDGELRAVDSIASSTGTIDAGYPTVLGTDGAEGTVWPYWFNGSVDDLRFFNYVLDSVEIATLYTDFVEGASICANRPVLDLVENCRVDLADLVVVVEAWMECGRIPVEACIW